MTRKREWPNEALEDVARDEGYDKGWAECLDFMERYMTFVVEVEGSDFLHRMGTGPDTVCFSEDERRLLTLMAANATERSK